MLTQPLVPNDAGEVTFSTMHSYGHSMFRQDVTKKMLSAYNDTVFDRYPKPNRALGNFLNRAETFEARIARLNLRRSFRKLRAVHACE